MEEEVIRKAPTFITLLQRVKDPRDNRGKRHELACVLACVLVAILSGRSYMSSIHRCIQHKIVWLKDIFQRPDAKAVSRAQLPNIMAVIEWDNLNECLEQFSLFQIVSTGEEWTAFDGKSLRGTIVDPTQAHKHERIVTAVTHTGHDVLCQQRFSGEKESEVVVVRDLLATTGLVSGKVSLDAGHASVET
ncbi:MAG: transposase family protein [Gammaproteobacteria bacterium]|nr:transposase family protein [Gammaproteobacteria bacterium]